MPTTAMSGMSVTPSSSMTMTMPASHTPSTSAAAAASSGMSGMSVGGSDGNACKISMLWNWYTIDACFLDRSWHITSNGMFAGSCIAVICLVITLEFLRRTVKEFDRYLIRQHVARHALRDEPDVVAGPSSVDSESPKAGVKTRAACVPVTPFRPTVPQQAIRALLHMLQFAVAYFIMLLAMYYNGYIIICIFIGAFLGSFIFQWEALTPGMDSTTASTEPTVCCG